MLNSGSKITQNYGNVAVLLGGRSAERNISLKSGEAIYQALKRQDIKVFKIDPSENLYDELIQNQIDRAFIALHGRDGEDGLIQAFLRNLNIPFTGCDMASSSLAMNKLFSKCIWQKAGVNTAPFIVIEKEMINNQTELNNCFDTLGKTLFVKPANEGSSLGISKVSNQKELIEALKVAYDYDKQVLVESFVEGEEYFVGVLNGQALPSIKVKTTREFYDYQAKYQSNDTEYFCPSGLNKQEEKNIQQIAIKAFHILGCSGWGRMDFIQSKQDKQFYILEANTIPGMTESSLLPKSAEQLGISFDDLVIQILNTSCIEQQNTCEDTNHG